jgi:hypothetical protein
LDVNGVMLRIITMVPFKVQPTSIFDLHPFYIKLDHKLDFKQQ